MKRRELLTGMLAGTAALALPAGLLRPAFGAQQDAQTLLSIVRRTIEVNGKAATVFGVHQPDGSAGLRFRAGDAFNVLLRNETSEATIVHWHGLTPPWPSDGVADAPLPLIAAGQDRGFDFAMDQPGSYWLHAHTLQEQALLAAPLIVADPDDDGRDEQEVVVLLHDFSFRSPEELLAGLTGSGAGTMDHGGMATPKADDAKGGMDHGGTDASSGMAMDLNYIEYDAYLANDRTLDDPEVVAVEKGGRVRLRIINGATATAFTIDTGTLPGDLIAVDGNDVVPVSGARFPISMGQRLDIRLQLPPGSGAFPILALREGAKERTGIILATQGADISKLDASGTDSGPVLDLAVEEMLLATQSLAQRAPNRTYALTLTGDMASYIWEIGSADGPMKVATGDRVELAMRNMSMMAHPMHLHGHHFQVVAVNGKRINGAVRDTVLVPPMTEVAVQFDTTNPGRWPFHCHHLYHMATGMMSFVTYENAI